MKKLLILSLFFLVFSVLCSACAQSTFAHPGGGPPFVKINGELANTNYYSPSLEDIAPGKYLVNQEITFSIDTTVLQVPKEIAQNSIFRWSFDNGKTTEEGVTIQHTFIEPKTHYVDLSVQAPGETEFTTLTAIQVNVFSDPTYVLPKPKIIIGAEKLLAGQKLLFKSDVTHDAASKIVSYFWDFGDGTTSFKKEASHIYEGTDFAYLVSLRVDDSKGYVGYYGFVATGKDKKLDLSNPFNNGEKIKVVSLAEFNGTNTQKQAGINPFIILGILGITTIIIIGILVKGMKSSKR